MKDVHEHEAYGIPTCGNQFYVGVSKLTPSSFSNNSISSTWAHKNCREENHRKFWEVLHNSIISCAFFLFSLLTVALIKNVLSLFFFFFYSVQALLTRAPRPCFRTHPHGSRKLARSWDLMPGHCGAERSKLSTSLARISPVADKSFCFMFRRKKWVFSFCWVQSLQVINLSKCC